MNQLQYLSDRIISRVNVNLDEQEKMTANNRGSAYEIT